MLNKNDLNAFKALHAFRLKIKEFNAIHIENYAQNVYHIKFNSFACLKAHILLS